MTDAPRSLEPSDAERLAIMRTRGFPAGAGGDSRGVGPIASRDVARAQVVGQGDTDTLDETDSKVDSWPITDDATSTFQTTFSPIDDSWNLELNGVRVHRDEFTVAGTTVTIADASDLFAGADTQGSPWLLEMQYDYLAGVPVSPTTAQIVATLGYAGGGPADFALPGDLQVGDLMIVSGVTWAGGWTAITPDWTVTANSMWKFVETEGPGDVVTAIGSVFICAFVMTIVRGVNMSSPISDFDSVSGGTTVSVTPGGSDDFVIYHAAGFDDGPLAIDRGTELLSDGAPASGHAGSYVASWEQSGSPVTGICSPSTEIVCAYTLNMS